MACFAFKAAKSAGAAPPALPQAESGTIIGLAAPMPKEEKKAVDLKDEEKGKAAIWKTFHLEVVKFKCHQDIGANNDLKSGGMSCPKR